MRKFFVAAAALAALSPATGMAQERAEKRFVHEGQTYAYTVTRGDDGRQVIEGRQLPDGRRFRLTVDGKRVAGVAGGTPVAFRVAEARGAARGAVRAD